MFNQQQLFCNRHWDRVERERRALKFSIQKKNKSYYVTRKTLFFWCYKYLRTLRHHVQVTFWRSIHSCTSNFSNTRKTLLWLKCQKKNIRYTKSKIVNFVDLSEIFCTLPENLILLRNGVSRWRWNAWIGLPVWKGTGKNHNILNKWQIRISHLISKCNVSIEYICLIFL